MGELESLIVHLVVIGGWSILGALLGYRVIREWRFYKILDRKNGQRKKKEREWKGIQ